MDAVKATVKIVLRFQAEPENRGIMCLCFDDDW